MAEEAGQQRGKARESDRGARGRTKADVDLHLAATAIDAGDTLVTNDGALLAGDIDGLVVAENWI